ncbi:MAG: hypothetical protein ABI589_14705 [Burkholderiales bacterium]
MRFFSRLFRSSPAHEAATSQREQGSAPVRRAAATRADASRASAAEDESPQAQQANRARCRELVYGVVRETLMRANVLSANYKFKVLALDVRGRQFLIMVDLAADALPPSRWNENEALMVKTAKTIHDLSVTAVYWRINPLMKGVLTVPSMNPAPRPETAASPVIANFAPLATSVDERSTEPAALSVVERPGFRMTTPVPPPHHENVEEDEVAALRQALAKLNRPQAPSVPQPPPMHTLTPAGFEDTRGFEERAPGLGVTQYGELT